MKLVEVPEGKPGQSDLAEFLGQEDTPITEVIDLTAMGENALQAIRNRRLKVEAVTPQEVEALRQNIYDKTKTLIEEYGEAVEEEFVFGGTHGEGQTTRLASVKSTPVVPLRSWDRDVEVTGVQLVERRKPLPSRRNPDYLVYRESVKVKIIGTDFRTGDEVESTPYKIGIDDDKFITYDRNNSNVDLDGLKMVSSYINYMYKELASPGTIHPEPEPLTFE